MQCDSPIHLEHTDEGLTFLRISHPCAPSAVTSALLSLNTLEKVAVVVLSGLELITSSAQYTSALGTMNSCTKVLVAAVNGPVVDAGCDVALCCDLVVVSDSASFSAPEVTRCLHPGHIGARYAWTRKAPETVTGQVPASQMISLGIAVRLTGEVKEDAVTLASYLVMVKQYLPYMKAALVNSPRYRL